MAHYLFSFLIFMLAFGTVPLPTSLQVTVRNELGNTVSEASVLLFDQEENYLQEIDAIASGITNQKGLVKFSPLNPMPYYILVQKDGANNRNGGELIQALKKGRKNKATVIIE